MWETERLPHHENEGEEQEFLELRPCRAPPLSCPASAVCNNETQILLEQL